MILLTGASGFIGTHLLASLQEKYGRENVLALTSKPIVGCNYLLHHNYTFNADYFADNGYADSITTVIHAGAATPKSSATANDRFMANSNINATSVLLDAYLPNLQKFIFLSTLDVYGEDTVITEESPLAPVSLYGLSKLYAERMVAIWASDKNKIVQILRVGHVYGPGEEAYQKIIPVTIKNILQDKQVQIFGTGNEIRSFIYIKDVVEAIIASLELKEFPGPINIVSGNQISILQLVYKLIAISGKNIVPDLLSSNRPGRDFIFSNQKMKQYLLKSETLFDKGILEEWSYMEKISL